MNTQPTPARSPFDVLASLLAGEPQPQVAKCGEVVIRHYLFEGPQSAADDADE